MFNERYERFLKVIAHSQTHSHITIAQTALAVNEHMVQSTSLLFAE